MTASHLVHRASLQAIEDGRDQEPLAHLVEHVYTNYRRLLAATTSDKGIPCYD